LRRINHPPCHPRYRLPVEQLVEQQNDGSDGNTATHQGAEKITSKTRAPSTIRITKANIVSIMRFSQAGGVHDASLLIAHLLMYGK